MKTFFERFMAWGIKALVFLLFFLALLHGVAALRTVIDSMFEDDGVKAYRGQNLRQNIYANADDNEQKAFGKIQG